MSDLSSQQLAVLKADILADPTLAEWAATGRMAFEISEAYNVIVPAWIVWKSAVSSQEWRDAIIGGGGATQLDALTASKRSSLLWAVEASLNPSDPDVRAAIDDFCGSQNTLKAALLAAMKRSATRAEKLFSTGTGSSVSPATMAYEGSLTYQQVEAALALP